MFYYVNSFIQTDSLSAYQGKLLNDKFGWNLSGAVTSFTLPNSANEAVVNLSVENNNAWIYNFHIATFSGDRYYISGFTSGTGILRVYGRTLSIYSITYNGVDKTSAGVMEIWYR